MKRLLLSLLSLASSIASAQSAPLIIKQDPAKQHASSRNIRVTNSPAFSASKYVGFFQILLNDARPDEWYNSAFAGSNATEALTAAVVVPSTAANLQTNGIAGYVRSDRAQLSNGGDVAGFFYAQSNHDSSAVFPVNSVAADAAGKKAQILSIEHDYNVSATDTTVNGINLVIVGNTTLTGFRNALIVQGAFHPQSQWSNGLVTADGAIESGGYAAFFGAATSSAGFDRDSQVLGLVSYNSDNTRYVATIRGDHTGGIAVRPGGALGSVAFQAPNGAVTWASVGARAFTMSVPVILKSYTVSTLPTCDSALKGAIAQVTDASSPTYNAALTGGGSDTVPAFCNGTAWTSH